MKPVKVIRIESTHAVLHDHNNLYRVYITKRMASRVPEWVWRDHVRLSFYALDSRYMFIHIRAKDELEAFTRFQRLWAGIPEE